MSKVWMSALDVLGLLLVAAGLGSLAAALIPVAGVGCGLLVAGAVILAGSQLAAHLAQPTKPDPRTDGEL